MPTRPQPLRGALLALALTLAPGGLAGAEGRVDFRLPAGAEGMERALIAASPLAALPEGAPAQDLFAAARSEYGALLSALYARGHYAPVIRVLVDGVEAASIPPLDAPDRIGRVTVEVDPGPPFVFGAVRIAPLAPGATLPDTLTPGAPAEAGALRAGVAAGVEGWRARGHAKAAVAAEDILADHRARRLSADIALAPGPQLRFGPLRVEGAVRVRETVVRRIAGLPEGEVFDPAEIDRAATRLRRSGVFSSVSFTEDEGITPPDRLGLTLNLAEAPRRRYSFGAEVASADGLSLTGYWLHRNLNGGAERLKVEGAVTDIGSGTSGMDYRLGVTLDRPATFTPDTTASLHLEAEHLDEADYAADVAGLGLSFAHVFSDRLTGSAGVEFSAGRGRDPGGAFSFANLSAPVTLTWDGRDSPTDPRRGAWVAGSVKPFLGFGTTDSGVKLTVDGRAYRSFGDRLTLAGRVQGGAILGAGLLGTPRDELFFSGGGGTVRGHPYRSLGVAVARGFGPQFQVGGLYMAAASVEARVKVTGAIGAVAFFDVGTIGVTDFVDDKGGWHSGAGLGLRYDTGLGPLRLDVAVPVGGDTGDGVQVYIGLGQSF